MKVIIAIIGNVLLFGLLYLIVAVLTYLPIGIYVMGCGTSCSQYENIPLVVSAIVLIGGYVLLTFLQQNTLKKIFGKFNWLMIPIILISWVAPLLSGMLSIGK